MSAASLSSDLRNAGKAYSACAKALAAKLPNPSQPKPIDSERLIALGIASDWTRRAAALSPLHYSSLRMRKSRNAHSVSEMLRFNLSWFGMNAIFARNSIFSLLGVQPEQSELRRFKKLIAACNVPPNFLGAHATVLHKLLQATTTSFVPGLAAGQSHPTLRVIQLKYTPLQYQSYATGKVVAKVLSSGNYSALDVPTLIYLMRNWSVHGGIIGSSFRSVPRFKQYLETVSDALATIHVALANRLKKVASAP
jgi:hypothetical protein